MVHVSGASAAFLLAGVSLLSISFASSDFVLGASPVVNTTYGPVQGYIDGGSKAQIFNSIPFAAPPTGDLRFRRPQVPGSWTDVKDVR